MIIVGQAQEVTAVLEHQRQAKVGRSREQVTRVAAAVMFPGTIDDESRIAGRMPDSECGMTTLVTSSVTCERTSIPMQVEKKSPVVVAFLHHFIQGCSYTRILA